MGFNFDQYTAEGNTFLNDYAKQLSMENDKDKAGRVLTSILYALRDIISPIESLQLIAQLPMFIKALYVNGWAIGKKRARVKNLMDFIELVKKQDGSAAINDFGYNNDVAENYIHTTFSFLKRYVSQGELEDIRDVLPKGLKNIIPSHIMNT
ncbi:MAG: DUF2267 domain-containing protein [Muricauda sp.]|nr:DUF2267 domain-containing protein [Allomuricauda sp.]MBA4746576.1 DUF2267 domain-containing protein [Allomuricauda sp.]